MNKDSVPDVQVQRLTKGAATREAIKAGARRAIAVDGFGGVKVADIMAAAGRSPGAFYMYFKSKEALLHELIDDFQHRLRADVNAPLRPGEDPAEHLVDRLRSFWRIYREEWPIATAAFQMSMVDQQFARAWHNIRQQGIRGFAAVVRMAQKNDENPGLDPELVASAMTSMIEYACYNWTARGGDFPDRVIDDDMAMEVLAHLVRQGLRSPRDTGVVSAT
ncbi:MAG: TetR/AcrR family transcriptional regulator [Pseudomonadota bacterium]